MPVLVLGDTHVGNHMQFGGETVAGLNVRCKEIIQAIDLTIEDAIKRYEINAIVQLGDFFDTSRPNFATVCAAMDLVKKRPIPWHIITGNHDRASYGTPCSVSPFGKLPNVFVYETIVRTEINGAPWIMVPHVGNESDAAMAEGTKLRREVAQRPAFVAAHYGLVDNPRRPDQVAIQKLGLLEMPNTTALFGHEHTSRTAIKQGLSKAISVGSFAAVNFGDGRATYNSYVIDGLAIYRSENIHAPRFITISEYADIKEVDYPLYLRGPLDLLPTLNKLVEEGKIRGAGALAQDRHELASVRMAIQATADQDALLDAVLGVCNTLDEQGLVYEISMRNYQKASEKHGS